MLCKFITVSITVAGASALAVYLSRPIGPPWPRCAYIVAGLAAGLILWALTLRARLAGPCRAGSGPPEVPPPPEESPGPSLSGNAPLWSGYPVPGVWTSSAGRWEERGRNDRGGPADPRACADPRGGCACREGAGGSGCAGR